jgi:hypothetical protein
MIGSLSLHISSPRDGERLSDYEEPLSSLVTPGLFPAEYNYPYRCVIVARQRRQAVYQLARILASMDVLEAPYLLAQCYELASSATRKWID